VGLISDAKLILTVLVADELIADELITDCEARS